MLCCFWLGLMVVTLGWSPLSVTCCLPQPHPLCRHHHHHHHNRHGWCWRWRWRWPGLHASSCRPWLCACAHCCHVHFHRLLKRRCLHQRTHRLRLLGRREGGGETRNRCACTMSMCVCACLFVYFCIGMYVRVCACLPSRACMCAPETLRRSAEFVNVMTCCSETSCGCTSCSVYCSSSHSPRMRLRRATHSPHRQSKETKQCHEYMHRNSVCIGEGGSQQ